MPNDSEYCKFCGQLGECEALCRPLTVADCLQVKEVRALMDFAVRFRITDEAECEESCNCRVCARMAPFFAPFLAALEKEKDHE